MSYDSYDIFLIFFLLFSPSYSCYTALNNVTYGHIENLNFYLGKSQPNNTSCSWIINHDKQYIESYYIVSLRIIQLENDRTLGSNELILKSDKKQIILDDITQRTFLIPSSSDLQIYFHSKTSKFQSTSLNIHRFLLEFIHVNNNYYDNNYFRCSKRGLIIPKQWKCNCLYECSDDDYSDEENCPLCSMIKSSNSLLCHSNETWCLPLSNQKDNIDPKGVCVPSDQNPQCSYSSNCETIISYYQDHGDISLDDSILLNRQSLCFIIIAKENHKIKLTINQYNFINQHPELDFLVYDGSEQQNQLLISSNWLFTKQIVQTHEHHIATIIIRKRAIENDDSIIQESNDKNNILLNISWLISICPENQMVCGGHFETKCYTTAQRCDGHWDCISGDDELGCLPASCPKSFACNDPIRLPSDQPRCYTWYERCNGNAYCANHTDEKNCTNWWCNSNNGTFLCKNLNCIYETWACDGADDCGDNSDEINCPTRIPRRIMAAAVIGATTCCTLFIIALGCTCKLFHLRSAERRASSRLLNPQRYIEQRREERQRRSSNHQQTSTTDENSSDQTRRIAPPSYNQTMGFSDDNEERQAFLAEHLRLAGLANFIPSSSRNSSSRATRHRNRRHRRHRRHHHSRRNPNEGSQAVLLEPTVTHHLDPPQSTLSINRFDRFRSRVRSLFTRNLSVNNNSIASNEFDINDRRSSMQPMVLTTRSCIESRELPPPYSIEQLTSIHHETDIQSSPITTSSRLMRIHKQQIPLNTIRNHLEEQPSTSPPVATIEDDEQASSDDDDDKMLVP